MNLQENISRIKLMMGLITEDSKWKPCKKCMKSYSKARMEHCAYQAIERFEETYGTEKGESMGSNYFESKYDVFNLRIMERIDNVIGSSAWNSMTEKFKMQLWSFMFNSDSASNDRYRWLAALYLTANKDITEFSELISSKIIDKTNLKEWDKAKELVSKTSSWDYNKFIKMLDGQYGTYGNEGAYKNTWSIRPTRLTDMYNECKGGNTPEEKNINSVVGDQSNKVNLDQSNKVNWYDMQPPNVADKTIVEKLKK
jgi:hypothetical protein